MSMQLVPLAGGPPGRVGPLADGASPREGAGPGRPCAVSGYSDQQKGLQKDLSKYTWRNMHWQSPGAWVFPALLKVCFAPCFRRSIALAYDTESLAPPRAP